MVSRLATVLILAIIGGGGCAGRARPAAASDAKPTPQQPALPRPVEARAIVLGTSVKGVPIEMHVFGGGPEVTLIFSAIHGDETTAAYVGRKLLDELRATPAPPTAATVALIPITNPDGVAARTRTNANGVDCNRNFPATNWKRRPGFLRSNPGTRPASEPETLAVMKAVEMLQPARILSIHSGLRCNNYDGPAQELAALLARHNGYPVQGSVGYPTPGSFGSWAGVDLGIPVVTLELPRHNNGEKAWDENRAALLAVLGLASDGAQRLATGTRIE